MRGFKLAMAFLGLSLGIHFLIAAGWPNPSLDTGSGGNPVMTVIDNKCVGTVVFVLCPDFPGKKCGTGFVTLMVDGINYVRKSGGYWITCKNLPLCDPIGYVDPIPDCTKPVQ